MATIHGSKNGEKMPKFHILVDWTELRSIQTEQGTQYFDGRSSSIFVKKTYDTEWMELVSQTIAGQPTGWRHQLYSTCQDQSDGSELWQWLHRRIDLQDPAIVRESLISIRQAADLQSRAMRLHPA